MIYVVYVLRSKTANKSYVGMTNDLQRRVEEHNSKKHRYTKQYTPWELIYTEKYDSRLQAHNREKYLKSAAGRRFLRDEVFCK